MRRILSLCAAGALAWTGLSGFRPAVSADQTPPPPLPSTSVNRGLEVQTRGPIHQAFAQPGETAAEPSIEVPKRPPDPIPELPPDQKPAGKNVQWIPGYWHWDTDKNDFTWISGVYRDVPPGRKWVAGSWTGTQDGKWRFVDGYWTGEGQRQREFVPPPPASLENGPSAPAPDANSVYTPGSWMHQDQRWLWRPGYYLAAQPGRVWIGPRYVWTPAGCLFVDGYWDYPLEERGYLYPPVYFTQPLWLNPGWCYRPGLALDFAPLLSAFFVGPGRHHYYYGDYFGSRFSGLGYRPWYGYGRGWVDPLFNYYGWRYRGNPGWVGGLGRGFAGHHANAGGGRGFVAPQHHFQTASRSLPAFHNTGAGHHGSHVNNGVGAWHSGATFNHSRPATVHGAHGGGQHFTAHTASAHHFAAAPSHHAGPAQHVSSGHGGGGHGGGGHGGSGHGGGGHGGGGHGGGHHH
jgi:hypothetical protein